MCFDQKLSIDQIRQNKLQIKQKLKLNLESCQQRKHLDQINTTDSSVTKNHEIHIKVLERIGLVEK
jgi:hypothetical protein